MTCEGIGQTIVKNKEAEGLLNFCTAVDPSHRIYTKDPPDCPPEVMEICAARVAVLSARSSSKNDYQEKPKDGPVNVIR